MKESPLVSAPALVDMRSSAREEFEPVRHVEFVDVAFIERCRTGSFGLIDEPVQEDGFQFASQIRIPFGAFHFGGQGHCRTVDIAPDQIVDQCRVSGRQIDFCTRNMEKAKRVACRKSAGLFRRHDVIGNRRDS